MSDKLDDTIKELFAKVQEKKSKIKNIGVKKWITNGVIECPHKTFNLNVIDLKTTLSLTAFLIGEKNNMESACQMLGVKFDNCYYGFKFEDWFEDLKHRMDFLTVNDEKKSLEKLEKKLDSLVSPEMKRAMEITAIEKLLNS